MRNRKLNNRTPSFSVMHVVLLLLCAVIVPPQRQGNKNYHEITCEKHKYLANHAHVSRIEPTSSQKTMNQTVKTMHRIALVLPRGLALKNA